MILDIVAVTDDEEIVAAFHVKVQNGEFDCGRVESGDAPLAVDVITIFGRVAGRREIVVHVFVQEYVASSTLS